MKTNKAFKLPSGSIVPAGTELHFSNEGQGFYNGETVERAKIPEVAIEMAARGNAKQGWLHGSPVYDPMTIKFKKFKPEDFHNAIIVGKNIYVYIWDQREVIHSEPTDGLDMSKAKIAADSLEPVKGDKDFEFAKMQQESVARDLPRKVLSAKDLANELKRAGLERVTMAANSYQTKPVKNWEGKMMMGVRGGSIGPMTSTDQYRKRNDAVEEKLRSALGKFGLGSYLSEHPTIKAAQWKLGNPNRDYMPVFALSNGKFRVACFSWDTYDTNTPDRDLDPGYQTYWFTLNHIDVAL